MKYVDVRTVDPKTLVDRSQLKIDESLPREERLKQYIAQLKNPYCYQDQLNRTLQYIDRFAEVVPSDTKEGA